MSLSHLMRGSFFALLAAAIVAILPAAPASAQRADGVNGRNATVVYHQSGRFETRGGGNWTEYDRNGRAIFRFSETNRDDWSVYLLDRSRNVRLQLDLHRNWIRYADGNRAYSDMYRITSARRQQAQPRRRRTRMVNAGPIWSDQDARVKCPVVAHAVNGNWTGTWKTTVQGSMSVCEIAY